MDQAEAIVATMRKLPEELSVEATHRAERDLVELARSHNPRDLRMAANLVVELLAPEIGEADAEAAIRRLDAEADAGRSLFFYDDPVTGGVGLRGCASTSGGCPPAGPGRRARGEAKVWLPGVSRPATTGRQSRSVRMP
jgi:hypothetical protein